MNIHFMKQNNILFLSSKKREFHNIFKRHEYVFIMSISWKKRFLQVG